MGYTHTCTHVCTHTAVMMHMYIWFRSMEKQHQPMRRTRTRRNVTKQILLPVFLMFLCSLFPPSTDLRLVTALVLTRAALKTALCPTDHRWNKEYIYTEAHPGQEETLTAGTNMSSCTIQLSSTFALISPPSTFHYGDTQRSRITVTRRQPAFTFT